MSDVPCLRIVQGRIKLPGREEKSFSTTKSHLLSEQNYDIKQLFKQLNIFIWENQQEIFSNMMLSWSMKIFFELNKLSD